MTMSTTFHFNPNPLLINPVGQTFTTHLPRINFASRSHLCHLPPSLTHKILIQKPIVCARNSKRRYGSRNLWKIFPKILTFMASECKIFPVPINVVIEELGDVCFNGSGPWKGLKGLSFDRLRRKRKRKPRSLLVWVVFGLWCFFLFFSRRLNNEFFLPISVFGLFGAGVLLSKGVKRVFKDWILGLLFVVALVGLGFKRENLKEWVERISVYPPAMEIVQRKRKW